MQRMNRRILLQGAAVLACVALIAACGPAPTTSAPATTADAATAAASAAAPIDIAARTNADGKTFIRVAIDQDPGTYDPAVFGSPMGLEATAYSFRESLFERDAQGNLIPLIAKDWSVEEDGLTYHVEMYDYVTDSAGNHLTADDVVFSFMRAKENAFNATSFYDSVEKDGDYGITIKLNSTSKGVFEQVMQVMQVYSQKAYEDAAGNFGTEPVFTGMYELTDWEVGTSLTFEKRADYWQTPELSSPYAVGNVDIMEFFVIPDPTQVAIALQNGSIDMVGSLNPLEAVNFMPGGSSAEGFEVKQYVDALSQVLYLNASDQSILFNNVNLRQAIMHAIDVDALIEGALDGNGIAAMTFGNSTIVDYQTQWESEEYFPYSEETAKSYLEQANYGGETLRILTNTRPLHTLEAQIIQAYLQAVGINAEIDTLEDAMFNTAKNDPTQWDILLDQTAWSGPIVTKWRDQFFKYPNTAGNIDFISDPKYTELLEAAINVATYSPETVDAFHQYMKEMAYARGLFNQEAFAVSDGFVTDMMFHRSGFIFPAGSTYVWNQ